MEQYVLRVTFVKGESSDALSIVTEALTDDEALRSAHAVADFAEWSGATDLKVSVCIRDGREVGYVGDDGTDASLLERATIKASPIQKDENSN